MRENKINLILSLFLLGIVVLGCSFNDKKSPSEQNNKSAFRRLETYTLRSFKFSYYLIPAGLKREELIAMAREIHQGEPDAQLVLVDDDSQLQDYITYAKEVSQGKEDAKLPKEWADRHIIANLQKLMGGTWMLYEGNGYKEIVEFK